MGENIVGRFASLAQAEAAMQALQGSHFAADALQLIAPNPEAEHMAELHPQRLGGKLDEPEIGLELADSDNAHANRPAHGGTDAFVIVRAGTDAEASRAVKILESNGVTDLEHRGQRYEPGDWEHIDEGGATTATTTTTRRSRIY